MFKHKHKQHQVPVLNNALSGQCYCYYYPQSRRKSNIIHIIQRKNNIKVSSYVSKVIL